MRGAELRIALNCHFNVHTNFYTQKFLTQIWQIVSERIHFAILVIIKTVI